MSNTGKKFILILLLALILRCAGIISRPIWYDEAFSILLAEQGPDAILAGTISTDTDSSAAEEHPPAYYFILWGWIQFFGRSLISARMLSVSISLGIIFIVYGITNHLFDQSTALIAALIAAILPFQIHYGQEIRMYVLLTFWLCLTTFALLKRKWWLFSISAALAQYTHNLAAFYLIPLALTPIFYRDWKTLRSLTVAGLVSIVMYLPWAIHLPAQLSKVSATYWVEQPGFEKIFTLFLYFLPNMPLPNNMLMAGLLLAALTITLAVFQTILARKKEPSTASDGMWLAYLAFTPPLLLWITSQFVPVYIERALLPSHAIFCIWLAWVFTRTKAPKPIQALMAILIVASSFLGFSQHITYKDFPYGPFAEIDQTIYNEMMPGDIVLHSSKLSYLPSFYFNRDLPQGYIIDPPGSTVDTLAPSTRDILGLTGYEDIKSATADSSRVWFIIYQASIDEYTTQGSTNHPHLEYLESELTLVSVEKQDDITVYLFSKNKP